MASYVQERRIERVAVATDMESAADVAFRARARSKIVSADIYNLSENRWIKRESSFL